jgi:LacI family transcriptional regulator
MVGNRIALVMDMARAYERGMLRGISRYSQLYGPCQFYRKMPQVSGGYEQVTPTELAQWGAQGLFLREGPNSRDLIAMGLPAVIAPFSEPFTEVSNVLTDDQAIGKLGAGHLMECGFKHFAYCGLGESFFWSAGRCRSFTRAIEEAGYAVSSIALPVKDRHHISWSDSLKILQAWLQQLPKPTGLMACNDDVCLHVIEACKVEGIAIPDHVGLLGVGNDEMICGLCSPPLSSIVLSTEKAGFEAAQWLAQRIEDTTLPDISFPVHALHVVSRQSTDVLMIDDPVIQKTVRYIKDHAQQGIHVGDVLKEIPSSRSTLYKRFSEVMGQSIYDFIRRVRVERAARLLLETEMSISEIASALGFMDQKNVSRYFKQITGKTPAQYRKAFKI